MLVKEPHGLNPWGSFQLLYLSLALFTARTTAKIAGIAEITAKIMPILPELFLFCMFFRSLLSPLIIEKFTIFLKKSVYETKADSATV